MLTDSIDLRLTPVAENYYFLADAALGDDLGFQEGACFKMIYTLKAYDLVLELIAHNLIFPNYAHLFLLML